MSLLASFNGEKLFAIESVFEKDRFFTEGKYGKLNIEKFLIFAILYCKSTEMNEKLLKISIIFDKC